MKFSRIGFRRSFLWILVSFAVTASLAQGTTPRFALAISAPESVVLDSAIDIEIKITNTSEADLILNTSYYGNLPVGYKYEVRYKKEELLSASPCLLQVPKGSGLKFPCGAAGNFKTGDLQPGQTWAMKARLTEQYNFDRAGRYSIQVSRQETGMPIVHSNIVTVVVLPKS
jgi:hypothetical protein